MGRLTILVLILAAFGAFNHFRTPQKADAAPATVAAGKIISDVAVPPDSTAPALSSVQDMPPAVAAASYVITQKDSEFLSKALAAGPRSAIRVPSGVVVQFHVKKTLTGGICPRTGRPNHTISITPAKAILVAN